MQNRQGEVKNSVGNGEAKVLICTTHDDELRGQGILVEGCREEASKGEKNMGYCNSIFSLG